MYCKLTTYTVTDIHGENSANSRYVAYLQAVTPPPYSLNSKIANTAFILEQQQLPEPFVVSVLFI